MVKQSISKEETYKILGILIKGIKDCIYYYIKLKLKELFSPKLQTTILR